MAPPRSAQAKEGKNRQYDYNQPDEVNDSVHRRLLGLLPNRTFNGPPAMMVPGLRERLAGRARWVCFRPPFAVSAIAYRKNMLSIVGTVVLCHGFPIGL